MAAGDEVPPEIGSGPNLTEPEGLQQEGIENIEEAQSGISHLDMIDVSQEERKVNAPAGVPTPVHSTEPLVVPALQTHLQVDEQANDSNNDNSGSLSGTSVSAHHGDTPWDTVFSPRDERSCVLLR